MIIGEKEVTLKLTGDVLVVFKETFGRDFFTASSNYIQNSAYTEAIDMIYAFVKAEDPHFMPYKLFMKELGNSIPMGDVIGADAQSELMDALMQGLSGSVKIKKKETKNQKNR